MISNSGGHGLQELSEDNSGQRYINQNEQGGYSNLASSRAVLTHIFTDTGYSKDPIISSPTAQSSIKINNTTIVIKPNSGKIDLKLFVGQIPKDWDERQVTDFFSKYGEILESQVIKDARSGQSKGCAFVKFASMTNAEDAIKSLATKDNPIYLPGVANPIQLRWADGEEQRLGLGSIDLNNATKLFVGSIPKHATEENLKDVFEQFGKIKNLSLIKESDGNSKGCAFLTYELKESSILAIRKLNAAAYILDHDKPLEVRFAEDRKVPTKTNTYNSGGGTGGPSGHSSNPYQSYPSNQYSKSWGPPNPYQMQPVQQQTFIRYVDDSSNAPYYLNMQTQKTQWEEPPAGSLVYQNTFGNEPYVVKGPEASIPLAGVKKQGPAGANLFVFHLPNEWRDQDLYIHFQKFGNIISWRIMTDKATGRSRGFGFVSYDDAMSARQAIEHMNGFQVGTKRLKVQIKQGDDDEPSGGMSHSGMNNQYRAY